jgi:hypothetical protein
MTKSVFAVPMCGRCTDWEPVFVQSYAGPSFNLPRLPSGHFFVPARWAHNYYLIAMFVIENKDQLTYDDKLEGYVIDDMPDLVSWSGGAAR